MTVNEIQAAIGERDRTISECEQKLNELQAAFLYEYDEVNKFNNLLEDAFTQKDMLLDMLLNGGDK